MSPSSPPSGDVMTEDEIASTHALTAYDAILQLHPLFLVSKVDLVPSADRQVYLNGILLGGLGELRGIPSSAVREILFVRAVDAPAAGIGSQWGAIVVISKTGR